MKINKSLLEEIYTEAGNPKIFRAKEYINKGNVYIKKVNYTNQDNFSLQSTVKGNYDDYEVNIEIKNGELEVAECQCMDYIKNYTVCKHIIATLLKFEQTRYWNREEIIENNINFKENNAAKYRNFKNVINTFYNEEIDYENSENIAKLPPEDKVKIEVKMNYDKFSSKLKLEFKIGNKRMYKIKDLSDFYTKMINHEYFKYGEKLKFVHDKENFDESYKQILEFILKYAEVIKYSTYEDRYNYYYTTSINKSAITLGENTIDEAFELLKNKKVSLDSDYSYSKMEFIESNPNIEFDLAKINEKEMTLRPNIDVFKIVLFKGKEYDYVLSDNRLYKCNKDFSNSSLKLIKAFRENYTSEMIFLNESLRDFYSIIVPKIKNKIRLQGITEKEIEQYKPQELAIKVFLDFDDNNNLTADIKFCYLDVEFNPLDENQKIKIPRNLYEENKNLNIFKNTGFLFDVKNVRFILIDDEKIYNFLTNDINLYMQKFEVMVTEKFKSKEIKGPKVEALGIKVENNLLNIDISKINISPEEIKEVMEKYKLKKKFHRLKDGSFLNLTENKDIEFIDKLTTAMNINYKNLENNTIQLPVNRSLYLNELLKRFPKTITNKNNEYKQLTQSLEKDNIGDEIKIPKTLENHLREYQKTGFNWLKTLDNYNFGGILADDMGLGKTIQILAIVLSYIENNKKRKTSIVISPSSLSMNWLSEAQKFAPSLKVKVILGIAKERKKIISEYEKYDLIITSYDLLKRDIEIYKENKCNFKYVIADEAQYLKNSTTQNAKNVKEINADTRFALTGTPIENSLAELWSIFDYIMPGYLFQYKKFKTLYEIPIVKENNKETMEKLKMLIEPFILRRTKKEVLTELPEKTITVLKNKMTEEQEKIYMSYLVKAKQDIAEKISINGFEKSQIIILATLTRLRQICCHPGLFLSDYKGNSSKLSQCTEIIEDAVNSGHKILLFSGYTSMFDFIQKELEKRNIKYFKLTGATRVNDRITLVDEFNKNPDIKIFLISLKAGGTGLNLTGADMVIHYNPWWNSSAENQATDRAYRIGQKNNVQVYKLITSNSIEEKIYELQKKKSELIDNMLSTKTSFINKFSQEEIMNLFN